MCQNCVSTNPPQQHRDVATCSKAASAHAPAPQNCFHMTCSSFLLQHSFKQGCCMSRTWIIHYASCVLEYVDEPLCKSLRGVAREDFMNTGFCTACWPVFPTTLGQYVDLDRDPRCGLDGTAQSFPCRADHMRLMPTKGLFAKPVINLQPYCKSPKAPSF